MRVYRMTDIRGVTAHFDGQAEFADQFAGIVGTNAGELISELCLAIEMGCEAVDISLTIHPHPTLAESVAMSAEAFEGTITDMYMPKKK